MQNNNNNIIKLNNKKCEFPASLDPHPRINEGTLVTGIHKKCLPPTNNQTYIERKKLIEI